MKEERRFSEGGKEGDSEGSGEKEVMFCELVE